MVSSRNILRRQKTHTKRVYPEKKAVQLPTNQGEPSMCPAQTRRYVRWCEGMVDKLIIYHPTRSSDNEILYIAGWEHFRIFMRNYDN